MDDIKVGDRVRSYDFPDRLDEGEIALTGKRACYIEGIVESVGEVVVEGCPRYKIRIKRRVWAGEDDGPVSFVTLTFPPLNGTPTTMGRVCNGVRKVVEQ